MKLVTFTTILLVNKLFEIVCSPGELLDFRHDDGERKNWTPSRILCKEEALQRGAFEEKIQA